MTKEITGVHALPLTPFTESGEIDEAALRKHLDFCVENGVEGLILGGKIGESPVLTVSEKEQLVEIAVDQVRGRAMVGLGIITMETDLAVALTKSVERLGGDYVMVSPPYPDSKNMLEWLRALAGAVDISLMLYDCVYGSWGQSHMSIEEVVLPLAGEFENIRAVKTTDPPEKVLAVKQNSDLSALCGWDMMTLLNYQYGADGVISASSAISPKEDVDLRRFVKKGNLDAARDIYYHKILPLLNWCMFDPYAVSACKQVLVWQGVFSNNRARPPLPSLTGARVEELRIVCRRVGILD